MQVLCKSTGSSSDIKCSICGQGFQMFWERQSHTERLEAMRDVQKTLRGHHKTSASPQAHPQKGFLIPDWSGPIAYSGAAILGHAPTWAL